MNFPYAPIFPGQGMILEQPASLTVPKADCPKPALGANMAETRENSIH
jgi:hypothetical protein